MLRDAACRHIGKTTSSAPTIRRSSRRCATSSGCISIHHSKPWRCVDEKSQIQALDRTQPILPLPPASPSGARTTICHGATTLFAARDIAIGAMIGELHRHHRRSEFLKFLRSIEANVPDNLENHLAQHNYGIHTTVAIQGWCIRHPRFHVHFTPPSTPRLSQAERWFAMLSHGGHLSRRPSPDTATGAGNQAVAGTAQRQPKTVHAGQVR